MSVNLAKIAAGQVTYEKAISSLETLGNATEGPLRVTLKNGMPIIGIRTWSQFFDEHFLGNHLDRQARETETAVIVGKYIPLIKSALKQDEKCDKINAKSVRLKKAIYTLRAKAEGVDLNPKLGALVNVVGAMTMPTYKNGQTRSATVKSFNDKVSVPLGLSMGTVPMFKVIADHRFSQYVAGNKNYDYGKSESICIDSGQAEYSENDYYNFYKSLLDTVEGNEKTVAIELYVPGKVEPSDSNRNGAWRAASEFVAVRKTKNNPASVLLCLAEMPEVTGKRLKVSNPQNAGVTKVVASTDVTKKQIATRQTDTVMVVDSDNDDESEN